jgi:hypothetical protein
VGVNWEALKLQRIQKNMSGAAAPQSALSNDLIVQSSPLASYALTGAVSAGCSEPH